jgi:hypothetical protein
MLTKQIPNIIQKWASDIEKKDPRLMTAFYSKKAILVGTFSYPIEIGREQIFDYFKDFLDKPNLRCEIKSNVTQVLDNGLLISSGTYNFYYENKVVKARYTFCVKKMLRTYKIINHHSSELPEQNK